MARVYIVKQASFLVVFGQEERNKALAFGIVEYNFIKALIILVRSLSTVAQACKLAWKLAISSAAEIPLPETSAMHQINSSSLRRIKSK